MLSWDITGVISLIYGSFLTQKQLICEIYCVKALNLNVFYPLDLLLFDDIIINLKT